MHARRLEGEWLDELPADDPRARRSRADLRRINAIMGNARSRRTRNCARHNTTLSWHNYRAGRRGRRLSRWRSARRMKVAATAVTLVDRQRIVSPRTMAGFADAGATVEVAQDDVFDWLERPGPPVDAIVANLFLHHFEDEPLSRMLALVGAAHALLRRVRDAALRVGARERAHAGRDRLQRRDAPRCGRKRSGRDSATGSSRRYGPRALDAHRARAGLFSHLFVARRSEAVSWDAIVIGGGPSGSTAARAARARGKARGARRESPNSRAARSAVNTFPPPRGRSWRSSASRTGLPRAPARR
jgi:hypothetical protein